MQFCQCERKTNTTSVIAFLVGVFLFGFVLPSLVMADDPEGDAKLAKTRTIIESNQQSTPAPASSKPEGSLAESAFQAGKGLAICLAILFIGAAFYKRLNPNVVTARRAQRMRVIDRLALGGRAAVLLVEVDGRQALVGVSSDSVNIQPWCSAESFENSMESQCAATDAP